MAKIVRVVPDAEVAENIAKMVEGTGIEIPENVVQPKLRAELEKLGVKIGAPEKGVNKTEQIEQALQAGLEVQNTIRLRGGDNEGNLPKKGTPEAIEYNRKEIERIQKKYGGIECDVIEYNKFDDEQLFTFFGYTKTERGSMSEDEFKKEVEKIKSFFRHVDGVYDNETKKIIIFADIIQPKKLEEVYFHENIHRILDNWYGKAKRGIAERFWDIAPDKGKVGKEWVGRKYNDYHKKEEFFTYWLSRSMRDGDVEDMISMLKDAGDIERVNNILKTLHYDRESEKQARLSEQNKGFVRGKEKAVDSDLVRGRAEAIDTMRSAVQSNY
jgi:hypothetical protein